MNISAVKAALKLVGYAAVVVIAWASGEFALCLAYGFLLIEASIHAFDTCRNHHRKHHENNERTFVSPEGPHPLPGSTRRMGVLERPAGTGDAVLPPV